MAQPSGNSISPTGNAFIDGLLQGSSWQSSPGVIAPALTYSLNINDDGNTPPNPGPLVFLSRPGPRPASFHLLSDFPRPNDAPGLNFAALQPHLGQPPDRVPLGLEDDAPAPH